MQTFAGNLTAADGPRAAGDESCGHWDGANHLMVLRLAVPGRGLTALSPSRGWTATTCSQVAATPS